ncbi:MAG: 50S ribosomal protein L29 [Alphaproteobacteria bacterium]|nr:50S ribosomal protein L29 [Alphaproteobacteria bacterium]
MAQNDKKAAAVRMQTDQELAERLMFLRKEQLNLRFQQATGQLANTARVNVVRKEIARILHVLNERQRQAAQTAQ